MLCLFVVSLGVLRAENYGTLKRKILVFLLLCLYLYSLHMRLYTDALNRRSAKWRAPQAAIIPNFHLPMRSFEVKNRSVKCIMMLLHLSLWIWPNFGLPFSFINN